MKQKNRKKKDQTYLREENIGISNEERKPQTLKQAKEKRDCVEHRDWPALEREEGEIIKMVLVLMWSDYFSPYHVLLHNRFERSIKNTLN